MTANDDLEPRSPYQIIGGALAVEEVVERFYDLMESEPAYTDLRALHEDDLGPMRASLAGFLSAWLGGPREWFTERPRKCLISAHSRVRMTSTTAQQWADAMRQAIGESSVEPEFGAKFARALADLALRMAPESGA